MRAITFGCGFYNGFWLGYSPLWSYDKNRLLTTTRAGLSSSLMSCVTNAALVIGLYLTVQRFGAFAFGFMDGGTFCQRRHRSAVAGVPGGRRSPIVPDDWRSNSWLDWGRFGDNFSAARLPSHFGNEQPAWCVCRAWHDHRVPKSLMTVGFTSCNRPDQPNTFYTDDESHYARFHDLS